MFVVILLFCIVGLKAEEFEVNESTSISIEEKYDGIVFYDSSQDIFKCELCKREDTRYKFGIWMEVYEGKTPLVWHGKCFGRLIQYLTHLYKDVN